MGKFRVFSDETKNKISATLKRKKINVGKVVSEYTREKMRQARVGKKHSADVIEKMRLAKKGSNHNMFGTKKSDTTKAKISAKHLGKIVSEDTKNKMRLRVGERNGFFGKKHTAEAKLKMSETKLKNKIS